MAKRRSPLKVVIKWVVVTGLWVAIALAAVLAYFAFTLPEVDRIAVFARRPGVTIVAADGSTIATSGDFFAGPVRADELPRHLIQALIATEDRRFYWHPGVDPIGLARALYVNITQGRVAQGGSTITQQLAKNVFLSPDRSLGRKIQEFLLALWLEWRFTKEQILTLYFNRVYLGGGAFGIEAAALRFFGHRARELSLMESAILVGMLQAPSRLQPSVNLEGARTRAATVLQNMVDAGSITPSQMIAALAEEIRVVGTDTSPVQTGRNTRYFTEWLVQEVQGYLGLIDRDLVVETTIDLRLQNLAERALAEGLPPGTMQGALVAVSPDGAVRAMIGGRDFRTSPFNRATDARRQPGSAFKPFVFLAAVEAGMRPDDIVSDAPVSIGGWSPRNFDAVRHGDITAREALARSVNTATVRVAQRVGMNAVIATARRNGITSNLRRDFTTALGSSEVNLLELTNAYVPFANGGNGVVAYGIMRIRDTSGRVLYQRRGPGTGRVISREALTAMNDMLGAVIRDGTGRAAAIGRPAGGKTGTNQDFRDAWFIGFTADLVAGVWMGNDDGAPLDRVTGGSIPARLWRAFMLEAHRGLPPRPLPGVGDQQVSAD